MNESQNNFNEELNTNVDNSVDTSINDIPAPTQPKAPFTAEEPVRPSIDDPIKPVINEPVTPVTNSSIDNGNKKGNKGLIIIIIVLVALLLGAVGYIAYSNGWFGEKDTEPTSTETEKEETKKEENKNAYIQKLNITSIGTDNGSEHGLENFKIGEKEYKISYKLTKTENSIGTFTTTVKILDENNNSRSLELNGLDYIAVMDDTYLVVKGLEENGLRGKGYKLYVLDSSLKDVTIDLGLGTSTFFFYADEYGTTLDTISKVENKYIDENTIQVGACIYPDSTNGKKQNYGLYQLNFKDKKIEVKNISTKENIACTDQA